MISSLNTNLLKNIERTVSELREKEPGLRARDAASRLGVSEMELVACRESTNLLNPHEFRQILRDIISMGNWMWLARTEGAVLEVDSEVKLDIDSPGPFVTLKSKILSIAIQSEFCRFICLTRQEKGPPLAVQFFDPAGNAILKVYLKAKSKLGEAEAKLKKSVIPKPECMDLEEFAIPQKKDPISIGKEIEKLFHRGVIEKAKTGKQPLRFQVENSGCVFCTTHVPGKLMMAGPWYNIMDRGFNLHLNEDLIAKAEEISVGKNNSTWRIMDIHSHTLLELTS